MDWDDEVDVVCLGSGVGISAVAVAAADAGGDVLIARSGASASPPLSVTDAAPVLFAGVKDRDTRDYFDSLTADVSVLDAAASDADLAIRIVSDPAPTKRGARIAPFYGSRLRDWTAQCLASPHGVLYTRLTDRGMTAMKTRSGEEIDVHIVGTVQPPGGISAASAVHEWLLTQSADRDAEVADDCALQRIVFEEDQIVGVVITTPHGARAVRTRHGIALSTGQGTGHAVADNPSFAELGQPLQVALVGHRASRFGRLELVVTEPAPGVTSGYRRLNHVQGGLRGVSRSHVRRGRKVHRYPPFG